MGYESFGPQVKDEAVQYLPLSALEQLPRGYDSKQDGGSYRLVRGEHDRYFDLTPGADSWKRFFFPARSTLFETQRSNGAWKATAAEPEAPQRALIGMRPCELAALKVTDHVFLRDDYQDPIYRAARRNVFVLTADCLSPCGTCFCASLGTGPGAGDGYDLNLTELAEVFLLQIGTDLGRQLLDTLPARSARPAELRQREDGLQAARERMGRELRITDLPELLLENLEHPRWDDVASRCLNCTNCTLVCPTCFCWDAVDLMDLDGQSARRERVWDSCFNPSHSYHAGGNTHPNVRARYRQWLTHKLGSWVSQFGELGCVGCGRCITWCPAGIDLTVEVAAIRKGNH